VKIEQILIQPLGQRFNAGTLSIKTYKKTWPVGDIYYSQVICMDGTGEIPVDVNVGKKYNPIRGRGVEINVIIGEVQEAEYLGKDRKKLVVEKYSMPTETVDEWLSKQDEIDKEGRLVVESKVRCWLVSASIQGQELSKEEIIRWQEFVLTGE